MRKTILVFGLLILALLILFQLSKYSLIFGTLAFEYVIAAIAIVFFVIGVIIQQKTHKPVHKIKEINHEKIKEIGLSLREYEVLCEIANGLSNKEIANKLFISESTIKTHVSNILLKLDAKRRTEAINKAKSLQILPF